MTSQTVNFLAGLAVGFALGAALAASAAELPAPPPAAALTPGPLHSATNLAPAEARAALSSALPPPSEAATRALLAPKAAAMPAFVSSGVWVDAVFLPLGLHETATPATISSPSSVLLCSPDYVRAVVWRYRRGTSPRDVPLDLEHASAQSPQAYVLLGRVVGAYYDEARGAVARIELTPAGAAAVSNSPPLRVSPGLRVVAATTTVNAVIGVEGADHLAIPWALASIALTHDPALPTPALRPDDLRPVSEIAIYPRASR